MSDRVRIYIALLDEGVDVWRPAWAEPVRSNVYRIVDQPYDRTSETWQFEPGDLVTCEWRQCDDGRILAATNRADSA